MKGRRLTRLATALLALLLVMAACGDTGVLTALKSAKRRAVMNLGTAGNYVILAASGISASGTSVITGDIGVSPAGGSSITGLALAGSGQYRTSSQVIGKVYAADYSAPTPATLAAAMNDMQTLLPADEPPYWPYDFDEVGNNGDIGGMTLAPGFYHWGGGIIISSDVTFQGGPDDVWILDRVPNQAAGTKVVLSGGALAENIFWKRGSLVIGANAQFAGIALCDGQVTVGTGASINGRLLTTGLVTLNACTITQPAP